MPRPASVGLRVADYRPDWWPADTVLLIRRVKLSVDQISSDPPITATALQLRTSTGRI